MRSLLRALSTPCRDERGIALVVAIFVMAILFVSGVFLVRMAGTENDIAYGSMWAEGSFFAADAAISVGMDRMAPNVSTATVAQTPLTGGFQYDGTVQFLGTLQQPGYALGTGTGYNPSGFVFYNFAITGRGTGPRSASRQIDVTGSYGPVAQ
jgi:hypothetical protein